MKYTFNDILNQEIYDNTYVLFVFGKYPWFNNMVIDTMKSCSVEEQDEFENSEYTDEFGFTNTRTDFGATTSVDFDTFIEVVNVANINGKWICKCDYAMFNTKQKEKLLAYIKDPSDNGVLIVECIDWFKYKDMLNNKILKMSNRVNLFEMSFPNKNILKTIVNQAFYEKGLSLDNGAIDLFLMKMGRAYDKFEETINLVVDIHENRIEEIKNQTGNSMAVSSDITSKELKVYMRNIQYFDIDDFVEELVNPNFSPKMGNKKIIKMMVHLIEENGAKSLLYRTIKLVDEYIEYRLLINTGYIPIGINYFYTDVMNGLPEDLKKEYEKKSEWKFRKQAEIASMTSLRDWEYMKIILNKPLENMRISESEMEAKCKRALYDVCMRKAFTEDRLNNIIGVDNILQKSMLPIDRIIYKEEITEA